MKSANRRPVLSVIGSSGTLDHPTTELCLELGRRAVEAGFRIACGGMTGVMEAVCRGAHATGQYREGDTIGIVPSYDRSTANPWVDVVVPTGMQMARNVLVVAMGDVVVAVDGGSGTLSEMAVAWQLGKPLIALEPSGGWAAAMAGKRIDDRFADPVRAAGSAEEAVTLALELLGAAPHDEPGDIGSGWWKKHRLPRPDISR